MNFEMIQINIVLVACLLSGIGVWLVMHSRFKLVLKNLTDQHETTLSQNHQHNQYLNHDISELQENRANQEKILLTLSEENKKLSTHFEVCKQKFKDSQLRLQEVKTNLSDLVSMHARVCKENNDNQASVAMLTAINKQQTQSTDEKLTLLSDSKAQMTQQFKALAHEIFDAKDKSFSLNSKERLEGILNPFNKQLMEFKATVNEVYVHEAKQRASLKSEINSLKELNHQLNTEAINLTNALKGNKKAQGTWGELILERVLEQSGLRKNHEYETQGGFRDADNAILKPDVIIHLPQNKDIIVDSKVSLTAYEKYASTNDPNQQAIFLKEHVKAIENHIKTLSQKDYAHLKGIQSLDFVLMFVPIEPAFMLAFQANDHLFTDAFQSKIIVVTPTTLLATLKTIENLWRYEKQNQNARIIAERAGNIYDKFRGFIEDIEKLGKQLDTTQNTYHEALNKLNKGKGNLVNQAQQLLDLGIKVKKEIPQSVLDDSDLTSNSENYD